MMINENFSNVPTEFLHLVESFHGCTAGNINSPVWICGLEWGGGFDPSVPIPIQNLEPYDFEELQCWSAKDFWMSFWAKGSKFCEGVVKLLIGIRDGEYNSAKGTFDPDRLAETNLIGPKGLALILNAFPLSMHGTGQRRHSWDTYQIRLSNGTPLALKKWTNLKTFDEYSKFVFRYRTNIYSNELQKRHPQLIVCLGCKDGHERLFGVKENQKPLSESFPSSGNGSNDCFLYMVPHIDCETYTLVLVTPFPQGSSGLNSNEKINNVSKKIAKIGKEYFGDEWLKSWQRERQPELLAECEQTKYNTLLERRQRLSDIINAASSELAKLEALEAKLSETRNEENTLLSNYIKSTKDEQKELMTNMTAQISNINIDINNMKIALKSKLPSSMNC